LLYSDQNRLEYIFITKARKEENTKKIKI